MASEVEICNAALINIGESTITSLTEDTKAARICNQRYEPLRDAVLRAAKWNFALERVELAKLTTVPVFGYSAEFQLPADFIRHAFTDDELIEYKIEGGKLLSNRDTAKILYVKKVTDPNLFDTLFIEALAARLAMDIAKVLADETTLIGEMRALYEDKIDEAKSIDAIEVGTPETFEALEWFNARL